MDRAGPEELYRMLSRAHSIESTFQACIEWHGLARVTDHDYRALLLQLLLESEHRKTLLDDLIDSFSRPSTPSTDRPTVVLIELTSGDERGVMTELLHTADQVLRSHVALRSRVESMDIDFCVIPEKKSRFVDSLEELTRVEEARAPAIRGLFGRIEETA